MGTLAWRDVYQTVIIRLESDAGRIKGAGDEAQQLGVHYYSDQQRLFEYHTTSQLCVVFEISMNMYVCMYLQGWQSGDKKEVW